MIFVYKRYKAEKNTRKSASVKKIIKKIIYFLHIPASWGKIWVPIKNQFPGYTRKKAMSGREKERQKSVKTMASYACKWYPRVAHANRLDQKSTKLFTYGRYQILKKRLNLGTRRVDHRFGGRIPKLWFGNFASRGCIIKWESTS